MALQENKRRVQEERTRETTAAGWREPARYSGGQSRPSEAAYHGAAADPVRGRAGGGAQEQQHQQHWLPESDRAEFSGGRCSP